CIRPTTSLFPQTDSHLLLRFLHSAPAKATTQSRISTAVPRPNHLLTTSPAFLDQPALLPRTPPKLPRFACSSFSFIWSDCKPDNQLDPGNQLLIHPNHDRTGHGPSRRGQRF
ncbi:uncharacterized protein CCOS01_15852, partial [Colletotrichum costaricense]